MKANLKLVRDKQFAENANCSPIEPKRRKRILPPKRESAADIAARIRKGRPPAKHRVFQETVKGLGDVVISNIGVLA
jgi:hypothetical protein